jgi:hypothetical protein
MANLILSPEQISVSLENKDGELRLDSRIMCEGFGLGSHTKYRNNVLVKYESELAELGVLFKTTLPTGEIVWYLNQDQVNFAGTLARNTEKAVAFKLNLVKAFAIAKQLIPSQVDISRSSSKDLNWQKERQDGKLARREYTDRISTFTPTPLDYAKATNQNYLGLLGQTAVEIKESRGLSKKKSARDGLNDIELAAVRLTELAVARNQSISNVKQLEQATFTQAQAVSIALSVLPA